MTNFFLTILFYFKWLNFWVKCLLHWVGAPHVAWTQSSLLAYMTSNFKILQKFWEPWVFFSKLLASPNGSRKSNALSMCRYNCMAGKSISTARASADKQVSMQRFWTIACVDKTSWEFIYFVPYACKTSIKRQAVTSALNFSPFLCVLLKFVFCTFQKASKFWCTCVRLLYIRKFYANHSQTLKMLFS